MNGLDVLERMGELARSGQAFALATVVWRQGPSSSKQGSRAIITADGKMKRLPIGTGARGEGTWKLSKDGFCTTWGGATIANCFTVVSAGDNKWSILKGSSVLATWSK